MRVWLFIFGLVLASCGGGGGGGGGGSASKASSSSGARVASVPQPAQSLPAVAAPIPTEAGAGVDSKYVDDEGYIAGLETSEDDIDLEADTPTTTVQSAAGSGGAPEARGPAETAYGRDIREGEVCIEIALLEEITIDGVDAEGKPIQVGTGKYKLDENVNLGESATSASRWWFPSEKIMDYQQIARDAGVDGSGAIIGIIDSIATKYVNFFKNGVKGVIEGAFDETPVGERKGFSYFRPQGTLEDGQPDESDPNIYNAHGMFVTLSALSVAPGAKIYYQNMNDTYDEAKMYEDILKVNVGGKMVYKNREGSFAVSKPDPGVGIRAPDVINLSVGLKDTPMTRYTRQGDGTYTEQIVITEEEIGEYLRVLRDDEKDEGEPRDGSEEHRQWSECSTIQHHRFSEHRQWEDCSTIQHHGFL